MELSNHLKATSDAETRTHLLVHFAWGCIETVFCGDGTEHDGDGMHALFNSFLFCRQYNMAPRLFVFKDANHLLTLGNLFLLGNESHREKKNLSLRNNYHSKGYKTTRGSLPWNRPEQADIIKASSNQADASSASFSFSPIFSVGVAIPEACAPSVL